MSRFRLVIRSLFFFWRVNLAVCMGVIAATAVLVGALLVGDSMRGSLRKISLDGLGHIDEMLLTERFFRTELANEIQADPRFQTEFERIAPIILFPNASATFKKSDDQSSVANKITLIGCTDDFWGFSADHVQPEVNGSLPEFDNPPSSITTPVVLNEPLANDLGISKSDLGKGSNPILTVQIPKPQLVNADNPIGKKEDLYENIARLEVVDIIPAESLGRFHLHPSQLLPKIVFLPIATVQE